MKPIESLKYVPRYASLKEPFISRLMPTPLKRPFLISFNPDVARLIGLDPEEALRPEFIEYFAGERQLPNSEPLAMLYAGHQFGYYVPQLGDGRAILIGEVEGPDGRHWDLHLKGAGLTPYSRQGDGRAVLRSTIREYLCGEAVHGLGIPTSRALCMFGSDEPVQRESIEPGALLVRVAPSHLRFGTFEVFYYRKQYDHLATLGRYALEHHFPELLEHSDPYTEMFREVTKRTAELIAQWQLVGFSHGVMNTDNMSLLGLTIDYGPYGFMDDYEPGFVCNHSDHTGRYAFDQQPSVGLWNLSCLGQALLPLMDEVPEVAAEKANAILQEYNGYFVKRYAAGMRDKLGLMTAERDDGQLASDLLDLMADSVVDYSRLFRDLSTFDSGRDATNQPLRDQFFHREEFDAWAQRYGQRLRQEASDDTTRAQRMNRINPRYVLRNYLAQIAIDKAQSDHDYSEIETLHRLLRDPCTDIPGMERYAEPPPDWGKRLEVSCSS